MKIDLLFVYSSALFLLFFNETTAQDLPHEKLDRLVAELMSAAELPGLSLAIVENEKIVYQKATGFRNMSLQSPIDAETVFEAASLTKPVFAYAVCRLVDEGKFDLDRPLETYWSYPAISKATEKDKITARMILTHSAGFPNWRRPRNAEQLPVNFPPGDRFSYSGEGFVYLSRVLEKITGQTTQVWISKMVFEPLQMNNSSVVWNEIIAADAAAPHNKDGKTTPKYEPERANAAASLHTTAEDYAKFMIALLTGKGLHEDTWKMMVSTQQGVDPACSQCKKPNSDPSFKEVSWGLGIGLERNTKEEYFWHWGDNGNFKSYVCASLTTGKGIVYFSNSFHGLAIRDALIETVLPGKHPAHEWVEYRQIRTRKRK